MANLEADNLPLEYLPEYSISGVVELLAILRQCHSF
jgi:hypothetical protein